MSPSAYTRPRSRHYGAAADTLTERELLAWWEARRASPAGKSFCECIDRLAKRGLDLWELSDLADQQVMEREDDMLFHVGTLCLRNGQRALWSQIYHLFLAHEGDLPAEDEFEFLDRMTAEARTS